jgi:hypothetical protein
MELTEVIALVAGVPLLIGFICGYGFRGLISRRRRAESIRRHFEHLAEERSRKLITARPEARLATFQRGDGTQPPL